MRLYIGILFSIGTLFLTGCSENNGGEFGTFLLIMLIGVIVVLIIFSVVRSRYTDEQIEYNKSALEAYKDFTPSTIVEGYGIRRFNFAVDKEKERFVYVCRGYNTSKSFSYSDVISSEVYVDDSVSETRKSTLGTIGGALAGGVLAGGVGAIIGGSSSKSVTTKNVRSVKVHILLRGHEDPFIDIECMSDPGEYDYQRAYEIARKVHGLLSVAIDTVERREKTSESLIEELEKLSIMLDKGVITQEEFCLLKESIINKR